MNKIFVADIVTFASKVFEKKQFSITHFQDPAATELEIRLPQGGIRIIKIAFYDSISMLIERINVEFFEYSETSKLEIEKCLAAAASGKLRIEKRKLFGIGVGEKIRIDE